MTYHPTTPILGAGSVSGRAIDAWFAHEGQRYAPTFGPGGQYVPPPAGLGDAIVAECRRYPGQVVNHDVVAAQVLHETAAWQSEYARLRNNPGGIGAINSDPDQAIRFPTVAAGIRAHIAHLLVYALGDGLWTAADPRRAAMDGAEAWRRDTLKLTDYQMVGAADTWVDLNGRWAYPGTTYGQSLITLANRLLAFADGMEKPDMSIPKPAMVSKPSPNRGGYSLARVPEAIVNHIATGTLTSNLDWLTKVGSGASSNYYIAKVGTIYELVPWQEAAWTNGVMLKPDVSNALIRGWFERGWNPNPRTITIEHEGEPVDTLTTAQITSNNQLTAWLHQVTGIAIDRDHILGHYQIDSVNRPYCPSFSDTEWRLLIDGAKALVGAAQPTLTPDPADLPAVRDPWREYAGGNPYGSEFWIPQPFIDWIEAHGGFWSVGFVATGAFIADTGVLTQFFEGAALEYHPELAGTEYEVLRRHIGIEVLRARYPDHAPKAAA